MLQRTESSSSSAYPSDSSTEGPTDGPLILTVPNPYIANTYGLDTTLPVRDTTGPKVTYHCPLCNYTSGHNDTASSHIRAVHLGLRVRCCSCQLTFTSIAALKKHYKIHHL